MDILHPTPEEMVAALLAAAEAGEIIHCMQLERGKTYAQRWGRQGKLFVPIRW